MFVHRSPGGNWTSPKGDPCLMYDVDFSKVQQIMYIVTENGTEMKMKWLFVYLYSCIWQVTAAEMVPLDAGSIACTRFN